MPVASSNTPDLGPSSGVRMRRERIVARDGVRLSAAVYTPRTPDPRGVPAVLEVTPYNLDHVHGDGQGFVRRGLAYVAVDVRGRGESEGDFRAIVHDADDGYDVVEWIVRQPWSDGRVVLFGGSYTGQNTWNGIDYGPTPNNGAGFYKDLSGNELPNAPHFTTSFSAEYSMPITSDWAATLHGDFYWQAGSWARVFNDDPYDTLHGYKNINLALILTNQNGWQAVGCLKNVFNTTAITGTFLNSDDSGLTTNIFLTDPRLFGVRITKNW